ncbi:MAG: hypothetical protein QM703_11560 [Gemmatales bacterium]
MPKRLGLQSWCIVCGCLFVALLLLLYPWPRVAECPGQYVLYSTLNQDESQLLVVTLPRCPFG